MLVIIWLMLTNLRDFYRNIATDRRKLLKWYKSTCGNFCRCSNQPWVSPL